MSTVGFATLEVIPSVRGLRSALEKQTGGDLTAAGRKGGQRFGDAAGASAATGFRGRFSGAMRGFNPLAGLAIGAGVGALFKGAIDEASALSESGNKINVVFGDAAGTVNTFADAASESIGQSDLQARNAAATFGIFGKSAGLAGQDLAGFSTGLTSLASDMASFYDTSVDEAIEAIGSGLRGEAEPLRRFGVLLDDATLRQEAMRQGLIKTTSEALTPQQKVLASHAVILAQTSDAQGDFARTADGLSNSQRTLAADWADMQAALGQQLLPAVTQFVGFLKDDALPALTTTGGVVKDAASAFNDLPGPVKAAAGAFVALRIASATGITAGLGSGVSRVASSMETLRLRTMLAGDAFRSARAATVGLNQPILGAATGMGRLSASFAAARVGAAGAGTAIKAGLGGAMGMLGGPWGIAIAGGVALLAKFWGEHREAKAHVEELTGTLNDQTGAITENTRAQVIDRLEKEGLLKTATQLGLNLGTVTDAALGNKGAMAQLRAEYEATSIDAREYNDTEAGGLGISMKRRNQIAGLIDALGGESSAITDATDAARRKAEADRQSEGATESLRSATQVYGAAVDTLRGKLEKLIEREKERALRAIQQRRDQIALRETFRAANEEAANGARVLFNNTRAADANMSALLDLGEQWANSKDKVKNAEGAYEDMRQKFIGVAEKMGATREQAIKLANKILEIPKNAPVRFQSEGYKERMAEIEALKAAMKRLGSASLDYTPRGFGSPDGYATGGMIGGYGSGTSDSNLIYASKGEFMQPKSTVDYYGAGFMEALRKRLIPRAPGYAQGGPITRTAPGPSAGVQVSIGQVVAHDYRDFTQQVQRRVQRAGLGGF